MPFIDEMCRSGVWIEALGQANACLTWCNSRFQADWKRNFGQLLRQRVISDAIGYKLEVIFGLEPVSLLFIQCILDLNGFFWCQLVLSTCCIMLDSKSMLSDTCSTP